MANGLTVMRGCRNISGEWTVIIYFLPLACDDGVLMGQATVAVRGRELIDFAEKTPATWWWMGVDSVGCGRYVRAFPVVYVFLDAPTEAVLRPIIGCHR